MSLLLPDSGLLFWMLLSFGVVFVDKYGGDMVLSCDENEFKAVVIL